MPSYATLHWQHLKREGVPPDLYRVFGEFQVFMAPRVGGSVVHRALRELADVIDLPTWVITPEMVAGIHGPELRPRWRRQWGEERDYVSDMMSVFKMDVLFWVSCVNPARRLEIDDAIDRCFSLILSESWLFSSPPRKRERRGT